MRVLASRSHSLVKRWWVLSALACIFASAITPWPLFESKQPSNLPNAAARRGAIKSTISASGTIEPVRLLSVGAQVSGRVVSLHVGLGDRVREGQLLAEIDSLPQINALQRTRAALSALKAQRERSRSLLKQAQRAFRRQADILTGKAGTQQDYEGAEAAYEAAKADLAAVEAQIEGAGVNVSNAETELAYTRITAPIAGTVVAIVTKQGQTVIASQIAPTIVKLADLGTMLVKAKVSEADVGRLQTGMPVTVTTLAQPDRSYAATLRSIDPAPDQIAVEQTGTNLGWGNGSAADAPAVYFNARLEIPNDDGILRPLMTAVVHFLLAAAEDAILVPTAAIRFAQFEPPHLLVLDSQGVPRKRTVRIGIRSGIESQIVEGIEAGEAVVLAGPGDAATVDQTGRVR